MVPACNTPMRISTVHVPMPVIVTTVHINVCWRSSVITIGVRPRSIIRRGAACKSNSGNHQNNGDKKELFHEYRFKNERFFTPCKFGDFA